MANRRTIVIPNVDLDLLREQRDAVLYCREGSQVTLLRTRLDGLVHLLDAMLDIGEGFTQETPVTVIEEQG